MFLAAASQARVDRPSGVEFSQRLREPLQNFLQPQLFQSPAPRAPVRRVVPAALASFSEAAEPLKTAQLAAQPDTEDSLTSALGAFSMPPSQNSQSALCLGCSSGGRGIQGTRHQVIACCSSIQVSPAFRPERCVYPS